MSKLKNLFFDQSLVFDSNISGNDFRIYTFLMAIYEEEKTASTISNNTLSEKVNIPLNEVKESIGHLIDIHYISKKDNPSLNDDTDNIYFNFKHEFYLE